jgi:DNA repair exonuclease SbcCD ATPase subunit
MSYKHHFAPFQSKQEKVSFDCSLPQPISCIKRVTTALPFPTDIAEALNFTAAYVDHSAHLAKHALHQFDHLQHAHSELLATAQSRAEKISLLQCEVKDLVEKNCGLESKYAELEKHHACDVKAANTRENLLKKELADTRAALKASETTVGLLRKHIVQDKREDIEREQQHDKHISVDHLRVQQAEDRTTKAEAEVVQLKTSLEVTTKKLVVAEASLKTTREQLCKSEATVSKLTEELNVEKQACQKLQTDLDLANSHVTKAKVELTRLRKTISDKDATILSKEEVIKEKDAEVEKQETALEKANDNYHDLDMKFRAKRHEVNMLEKSHEQELKRVRDEIQNLKTHHKIEHEVKNNVISDVAEVANVY